MGESAKHPIQEHFPTMTELYMTQHKADGFTIIEKVLQARVGCKKVKGKKLGSWVVRSGLRCEIYTRMPRLRPPHCR